MRAITLQLGGLVTPAERNTIDYVVVFFLLEETMPTWAINLLVLGGLGIYGASVALYFIIKRKRKKRKEQDNADNANQDK